MKRQNKFMTVIYALAIVLLVLFAVWCIKGVESEAYVVKALEHQTGKMAMMTYAKFDGEKKYILNADEKDMDIVVEIYTEDGSLDVEIKEYETGNIIYTGKDLDTTSFHVVTPDKGTYIVRCTGYDHEGSFSFVLKGKSNKQEGQG